MQYIYWRRLLLDQGRICGVWSSAQERSPESNGASRVAGQKRRVVIMYPWKYGMIGSMEVDRGEDGRKRESIPYE